MKLKTIKKKIRKEWWDRVINKLPKHTVTRDTEHGRLSFSNKDNIIGRSLYVRGTFNVHKIKRIIDILRTENLLNGNAAINIGAHIGTVAVFLKKSGFFEDVIAIEPDPNNYEYLKENWAGNVPSKGGACLECAVSSYDGEAVFTQAKDSTVGNRISNQEFGGDDLKVKTITLDKLMNEVGQKDIGLVYMDVEGHEYEVLKGGEETLKRGMPVVMEFFPKSMGYYNVKQEDYIELVSKYFKYFYDIEEMEKRPITDLPAIFERYRGDNHTDVLMF